MQNNSYLAAYLACNPSSASALLGGGQANSLAQLDDSSPLSAAAPTNNAQLVASLSNELNAARNSSFINQFLQQRQIEELKQQQQNSLLAQHVASLNSGVGSGASESAMLLALLHKKQQQDQQALQQKQLQELQACISLAPLMDSASRQQHLLQQLGLSAAPLSAVAQQGASSEYLAAAGLTGLASVTTTHQETFTEASAAMAEAAAASAGLSIGAQQQQQQHQPLAGLASASAAGATNAESRRKGRSGKFPHKLHQMLADLEQQDRRDIASFMPHGRAFAIHKPAEFTKDIMPKYFRMSRFNSFQRQLNLYDFQRISEGHDKGAYYVSVIKLLASGIYCFAHPTTSYTHTHLLFMPLPL
jgi:HSF-type DNA-binding